ncbi:MAG: flippase [Candidatus Liptonbacteria bacterium]
MFGKIKNFLFHNTSTRQTVAKNTFWLSVAHVGGRALRAIIIIYAARVLGASEWGAYNYAITLVAFLTLFVDLGISNILTRETARTTDPERRYRIISTSFVMKATLIAFGVLIVVFLAPHMTKIETAKALFPIVAWILVFDSLREFGFAYLRAIEKMEWEAVLTMAMNAIIVILGFVFLAWRTDVVSFAYSYALGTAVGMVSTVYVLRDSFKNIRKYFSPHLIKEILATAWPFAVSGVLGMLTLNTDVIIIGWFRDATDLGYYSAAIRLIQLLYLLPSIISISVLPTFARTAMVDNVKFRQIFERIVSMMFLVAIPIVVGGIITAGPLLTYVFGSSYAPGTLSFQLLLLTLLIDFPAVVLSAAVFAYNRQKNLILYSAIGGVANVIFDLVLIPRFGISGSAIATIGAQLLSNIYLWYILNRINNFSILKHLRKVFIAAIIMSAVTLTLSQLYFHGSPLHVLLVIAGSIPIYFGVLYFLREKLLLEIRTTLQPAVSGVPAGDVSAAAVIQEEMRRSIGAD